MQCPSCGEQTYGADTCIKCGHVNELISPDNLLESDTSQQTKSTLIEFPGVRSSLPEWRRELSVRVREVQERKAKEAAREAAEAEREKAEPVSSTSQLELLPHAEAPAINPLVAAALKRIERANQSMSAEGFQQRVKTATAVAYNPSLEVTDVAPHAGQATPQPEISQTVASAEPITTSVEPNKNRGLVVVQPVENAARSKVEKPKRLIVDDPNDPALNYLDSISRTLRVDEIPNQRASVLRRVTCAVFDLMTCWLLSSPIALVLSLSGVELSEARPLTVVIGITVVVTFLYFTLSIGLTGRTWAMRWFSLRVVDLRTGLIPTGSQSASRSFFFLLSLSIAGLGILYALVSRDGETMHDRFTRTAVIRI